MKTRVNSAPKEKTVHDNWQVQLRIRSNSHHKSVWRVLAQAEEPMHTAKDLKEPAHQEFKTRTLTDAHGSVQPWLSSLAQMEDSCEVFNDCKGAPFEFSALVMNRLKLILLLLELLAIPNIRADERNHARVWLRIQDIKDMLLLLVQGKLTNLTVEECLAFNVSLHIFTRSVVIQRRVEDLHLGVESYQKKLNLTKPDTYRSYLKRREAYWKDSKKRTKNEAKTTKPDTEWKSRNGWLIGAVV
ncbi:hypothetical protein Tco_0809483 [Tanacetum coccineum]